MAWWKPAADVVDLSADEIMAEIPTNEPRSLLDFGKSRISQFLDLFRGDEIGLETDIAAKTERLRQTRVLIEAFTTAERIIEQGMNPPKSIEISSPKVDRLVPRTVKGGRS